MLIQQTKGNDFMNFTTFSLSNLTDKDVMKLFEECTLELARREDAKTKRRKDWITNHYWGFMGHPNASVHTCEKRTIVATYNRYDGVKIGTAYPINGDVYDYETGVAVAYAKALGEPIPNYI